MDDLYRENILEHYKRPHNWAPGAEIEAPDLEFHDINPLCGDELTVQLALDGDGRIADIRFSGHGCAISQAAASMVSDEIKGMPVERLLRARPVVRARPAGDRHLRDPHQVRAAVPEGAQVGAPRCGSRVGADEGDRVARERPAKSDLAARI